MLEGSVLDAETGEGIEGARVFLTLAGVTEGRIGTGGLQPLRETYRTESDGGFRVEPLVDGRYQIDAEAPGYLSFLAIAGEAMEELVPWRIEEDGELTSPPNLSAHWDSGWSESTPGWHILNTVYPRLQGGQTEALVLRLRRGRIVRGSVRDGEDGPIAGAVVEVVRQIVKGYHLAHESSGERSYRANRPTLTDAEGRFEVAVHPATHVSLKVHAPGFLPEVREIDLLRFEGVLDVTLAPGLRLAGRVLTEEGEEPRREVHLTVLGLRAGSPILRSSTGENGAFVVEGAPHPPLLIIAGDPYIGAVAKELQDFKEPVTLRLRRERPLKGRVVDAAGHPVAGAFVHQSFVILTQAGPVHSGPVGGHDAVQADPSGGLSIVASLHMAGAAHADPQGAFEIKTLLDQNGRVYVGALAESGGALRGRGFRGWVDLQDFQTLVLGRGEGDRGSPPPEQAAAPRKTPLESWKDHLKTGSKESRRQLLTELREAACRTAGGHPPTGESDRPDLVPLFVEALRDGDSEVRSQAICALAYMNHAEASGALLESLQHPDGTVRYYGVMGLGWLGRRPAFRERAIEALRGAVGRKEESFDVVLHAASTLVELGALKDPDVFLRALREEDGNDALAACALGLLGRRDCVEILIERLRGNAYGFHVAEALKTLTGHHAGQEYKAWRAWFEAHRDSLPAQLPVEAVPADAQGFVRRGSRRYEQGKLEDALEDFERANALDPSLPIPWIWRGTIRQRWKDYEGALKAFAKAVELAPRDPAGPSAQASARLAMGDPAGAVADASRAIELSPQDARLWLNRGYYRTKKGDSAGAVSDFVTALQLGGADWDGRATCNHLLETLHVIPSTAAGTVCSTCRQRPAAWHLPRIEKGVRSEVDSCGECLKRPDPGAPPAR